MWTQRDQIQAYQFLRRRLVSALVSADANHPVSPSRRLVMGSVLGLIATLIVTAAFGIVGLIKPGTSTDWKKPGQVVIEKETGTRFVIAADGQLHPVLNYASARLLAGGDGSKTSTVPAKTLAELGRGAPLGIPGAPDSIPAGNRLTAGPMVVCSVGSTDAPAAQRPATLVRWSSGLPGQVLRPGASLLVTDGQSVQLVGGGYRYRLPGIGQAAALQLPIQSAVPVSAAWLSVLPAGGDLDFLAVNQAGQPGPVIGGKPALVGSVLLVSGPAGTGQHYLVLKGGIAPVTPVQAELALTAPANRGANASGRPVVITASALVGVPTTTLPAQLSAGRSLSDLPRPTDVPDRSSPICLAQAGGGALSLSVAAPGTDIRAGADAPASTAPLGATEIAVPPGTGGLVDNRTPGTADTVYLLADDGTKYPLANAAAQAALGYGKIKPVVLSSAILALLPTGPALDPAAASEVPR